MSRASMFALTLFADVAVGAKWADVAFQPSVGAAWIYSGRSHGTLAMFHGKKSSDLFGFAMSSVGDLDGDGILELAIGATQDGNGATPGFVAVYSGTR